MSPCSVYLVESGFPDDLPGFSHEVPSASFPFWGHYCLLDFAVAAFSALSDSGCNVIAEPRYRGLAPLLTARSQGDRERLILVDRGIEGLLETLDRDPSPTILICPLNLACNPDGKALRRAVENAKNAITRISIQNVETHIYVAGKRALLRELESYSKSRSPSPRLGMALFSEFLHASFEAIRNVPGKILFQNNLTQLYKENLWLVGQSGTVELLERLNSPVKSAASAKGALIDRNGHVKNSLISAGARVEGSVEGSFIFPGVVVHKGASVVNSVVMNGNRIGAKAQLYKTLVLPYVGDLGSSNIGESASIGMREAGARNFDFPKQVCEGVTVIGINAEVPKGLKIGSGCLVGARVGAGQLRSVKELPRSSTVLRPVEPNHE
jgi:tetrahydrodipicolinate N-succinyltransferase